MCAEHAVPIVLSDTRLNRLGEFEHEGKHTPPKPSVVKSRKKRSPMLSYEAAASVKWV